MVQERTQAQFEQVIEQRLTSLAQTQVSQIQRELEAPLLIAGGLVRVNALIGTPGADGQPSLSLSREQLISLIKENVARNPKILGTYIGWEKDALDHNDAAYIGTKVVGIDPANGASCRGGSATRTAASAWTNWWTSTTRKPCPPACAPASTTCARRKPKILRDRSGALQGRRQDRHARLLYRTDHAQRRVPGHRRRRPVGELHSGHAPGRQPEALQRCR
jgi:hypothetical protein